MSERLSARKVRVGEPIAAPNAYTPSGRHTSCCACLGGECVRTPLHTSEFTHGWQRLRVSADRPVSINQHAMMLDAAALKYALFRFGCPTDGLGPSGYRSRIRVSHAQRVLQVVSDLVRVVVIYWLCACFRAVCSTAVHAAFDFLEDLGCPSGGALVGLIDADVGAVGALACVDRFACRSRIRERAHTR